MINNNINSVYLHSSISPVSKPQYSQRIALIVCLFILFNCNAFAQSATQTSPNAVQSREPSFTYHVITAPGGTYGYEILRNNKMFIRQVNIPGMPGINGFKQKLSADRVARLAIQKLKNGEMPPTITEKDLKKLNAL